MTPIPPEFVTKNRIETIQGYLAKEGYYKGRVDGIIGKQTFDAMAQWNMKYGMPYAVDANALVGLEAKAHAWEMKKNEIKDPTFRR